MFYNYCITIDDASIRRWTKSLIVHKNTFLVKQYRCFIVVVMLDKNTVYPIYPAICVFIGFKVIVAEVRLDKIGLSEGLLGHQIPAVSSCCLL